MRRRTRWNVGMALGLVAGPVVVFVAGLAATLGSARAEVARPERIVSLNLCLDPLVLALAGRERIAALTTLSADPTLSAISGEISGIRLVRGAAEEVLALEPDLILAVDGIASATVDLLRRLGRPVVTVPLPGSIADIGTTVTRVASAVGADEKGRVMLARMDERLARAAAPVAGPGTTRPSALVVHVGGLVSRRGSFIDDAVGRAGFRNAAEDHLLTRMGRLELEAIVSRPPDLLILGTERDTYRTAVADNLRHPALARLFRAQPHTTVPAPQALCGTPDIATVVEHLGNVRRRLAPWPGTTQ